MSKDSNRQAVTTRKPKPIRFSDVDHPRYSEFAETIKVGHKPRIANPREKVGTALAARIEGLLKLKSVKGCGCGKLAAQMNGWGVAGVQQNREQIVASLVKNRDVLESALRETGDVWKARAAHFAPESVLRVGAEWLLDKAIEDVRSQSEPRQRAARPHRQSRIKPGTTHRGMRGISEHHPPLIGVPIDRDKLQSHILYHVMPLAGDTEWVWRRHCDWIREVRQNFNGRLIVGIVTPGQEDAWSYCPPEAVHEALVGLDAEFIAAPNDTGTGKKRKHARRGKGEGVLFPHMLERLKTNDPNHIAFYGHCKGVTRPQTPLDSAIHLWAEAMFETVFRNHDAVVNALDNHGVCGSFRMPGGYADGGPGIGSNWFFSGTFFAMRLVDVFGRNWQKIPTHYGCVEQWPRLNFQRDSQAACLFFDNVTNLYDDNYWKSEVTPAFEKWKKEHGSSRTS